MAPGGRTVWRSGAKGIERLRTRNVRDSPSETQREHSPSSACSAGFYRAPPRRPRTARGDHPAGAEAAACVNPIPRGQTRAAPPASGGARAFPSATPRRAGRRRGARIPAAHAPRPSRGGRTVWRSGAKGIERLRTRNVRDSPSETQREHSPSSACSAGFYRAPPRRPRTARGNDRWRRGRRVRQPHSSRTNPSGSARLGRGAGFPERDPEAGRETARGTDSRRPRPQTEQGR